MINDFNWKKALGLFLNLLANILTNYIGVTGSGLVYSLFIFLFDFQTKKAIPIYKLCNLVASILNIVYIFKKRKSDDPNSLELNWFNASFCLPYLFAGSMVGILVSSYFPAFHLLVIILIILVLATTLTIIKIMKTPKNPRRESDEERLLKKEELDLEPITLLRILWDHRKELFFIFLSLALLIIGNLSKGSELSPSPFFKECSVISFVLFFSCLILDLIIPLRNYRVLREKEGMSKKNVVVFAFISFVSGTITSFGISGSLIFATGLSVMNLPPAQLTSITRLSLFSSSLAACIQFFISGYLDVEDAVIISITSLAGSAIGLFLYNRDSLKGKHSSKKKINYILITILTLSMILMPFIMNYEVENNPNAFNYGKLC